MEDSQRRQVPSTSTPCALGLPVAAPPFPPGRGCRLGTSLPVSVDLRRPPLPARFAMHRGTRLALPTASTAASRSPEMDTYRAGTSMLHPFAAPTVCLQTSTVILPSDRQARRRERTSVARLRLLHRKSRSDLSILIKARPVHFKAHHVHSRVPSCR
jgi:hypothetical protein